MLIHVYACTNHFTHWNAATSVIENRNFDNVHHVQMKQHRWFGSLKYSWNSLRLARKQELTLPIFKIYMGDLVTMRNQKLFNMSWMLQCWQHTSLDTPLWHSLLLLLADSSSLTGKNLILSTPCTYSVVHSKKTFRNHEKKTSEHRDLKTSLWRYWGSLLPMEPGYIAVKSWKSPCHQHSLSWSIQHSPIQRQQCWNKPPYAIVGLES